MKSSILIFMICFLSVLPMCSQDHDIVEKREKKETIGKTVWYTEQNTFDEVLAVARQLDKPVLAVFSAVWCKPCQKVKKEVFASDGFQVVAKKAVLLYVEQTNGKAAVFLKKNNIRVYPTFKLFDKTGKLLQTSYFGAPERSIQGFSKWIDFALDEARKNSS